MNVSWQSGAKVKDSGIRTIGGFDDCPGILDEGFNRSEKGACHRIYESSRPIARSYCRAFDHFRKFGPKPVMELIWKKLPAFLYELILVFTGLSAAFALNNWQAERNSLKTRINYYESFLLELEGANVQAIRLERRLDSVLTSLETKIANGDRPVLDPLSDLDYTFNAFITKAAFQQVNFENIGKEYLASISWGSNLFTILDKRVALFQETARRTLYTANPDFYDENGNLRKEYAWYPEDLRFIRNTLRRLVHSIEKGAVPETQLIINSLQKKRTPFQATKPDFNRKQ